MERNPYFTTEIEKSQKPAIELFKKKLFLI